VFKIFPPLPAPVFIYEGKIESNALTNALGSYIGSKVVEVNNNNIDSFEKDKPNIPKCFLFTEKKGNPLIYRALSIAFDKKIDMGVVRSSETGIVSKYRIKKFPTILVVPVSEKKHRIYEESINYKNLFDFLNVFSETFFRVGDDTPRLADPNMKVETKAWKKEKLPEYNKETANEICFKVDGTLCVILVNKEKPTDELVNLFNAVQNYLAPKIDRGIKYRFGWVNSSTQGKFVESLGLTPADGPKMVLINPGSRKRFFLMENDLIEENMRNVFERLAGGELRFKNFDKNTIPDLV